MTSRSPRDESEFQRDDRNLDELLQELRAANVMAICGLVSVGLAISAAVLLVTGFVDHGLPAVLVTALIVCLFGGLWFVLPLTHRHGRP